MAWQSKRDLPPDWDTRRARILKRDGYQCRWMTDGIRCNRPANQVDHIGSKHDHSDANLRALCEWHHSKRTSAQGNAARKRVSQLHPKEKHPGLR